MATATLRKQQRAIFSTIHSVGTLLPVDMLQRIEKFDPNLDGLNASSYHWDGYKLNEVINNAWLQLLQDWNNFQNALNKPHTDERVRELTLQRWLLRILEVFGYGHLSPAQPIRLEAKEKSYPISYGWRQIPMHLVSYNQDLDEVQRTPGTTFRNSAYSLVQELLNNSNEHLWGIVSNGKTLRLLRRNVSLTRQAYVEFDLEAMMQGESYADFALFWLLGHQSRFEGERPTDYWLEKWTKAAHENGVRALDQLRDGVERAINALGKGFLTSTAASNFQLRTKLREGTLSPQDYYRQVLRLVYRLIVLFVAEDRDVLFHPHASAQAKQRYLDYYSTRHLRQLAEQRIGTRHNDLFRSLWIVMEKLGASEGYQALGLPALNGFLFSSDAITDLLECELSNYALLDAIRSLSTTIDKGVRRIVDYRNLGSEELGSVYESLLELHPELTIEENGIANFKLKQVSGNERKTSGSYYTPTSLIDCLLDSALDPVLEEACQHKDEDEAEQAILDLKICDPACGSGHFLIAAAHRIAKKLAAVRTGDEEPSLEERRKALRDVVGRCIYGVDINPMSVELCKVNLWMEAIDPGKPLSFLDAHILCGNSLLGTTPMLLRNGIPDSAFEPIEGDDKKACSGLKKRNKEERTGQLGLWTSAEQDPLGYHEKLAANMKRIQEIADDSVANIHHKQDRYEQLRKSSEYQTGKMQADAWCAAFVWKKVPNRIAITQDILRNMQNGESFPEIEKEIQRLSQQYQFFHWYLEFPDVFRISKHGEKDENEQSGWSGGFDVVLGNPPWEKIQLQEKEWFASRRPVIANAANTAQRKRMIEALVSEDADLYAAFLDDLRQASGESHFIRRTERYPLNGKGNVNSYAIFAENMRTIQGPAGRVGCIVPSGIATDDTTKFFFQDLMETKTLASLYSFENREKLFPAVDSRYNFALLTLAGSTHPVTNGAEFIFFAHKVIDVQDEQRRFTLSDSDIKLLNPNTQTCPIFRSQHDMTITKAIYEHMPVIIREEPNEDNPWKITCRSEMFNMSHDSHLFNTIQQLEEDGWQLIGNIFYKGEKRSLPLYEGKMIWHYNHRFNGYDKGIQNNNEVVDIQHNDPYKFPLPRYWVYESEMPDNMKDRRKALLAFRKVTNSTNNRSAVNCVLPYMPCGDSLNTTTLQSDRVYELEYLSSCTSSFVFDYVVRQKLGNVNLNMFILKQLPILPPEQYKKLSEWNTTDTIGSWILPRALELNYTAWDLETFAKDCDYDGPPFIWKEERRFLLRCELDAAYFHLYGIAREDVNYIMETFPIVKHEDEKEFGEYRTKRVILEIYDELQRAIDSGEPYQTRLDPPPADPAVAHPARVVEG